MTIEAVSVILEKVWEMGSQASIFTDKKFVISPDNYDWKTYDDINTLCIFNKNSKIEIYLDVDNITEILVKDEQRSLVKDQQHVSKG